ncbi:MAG: PQQ-dependent sugar dehydrogenase [Bacteroidetes bacterium]|nr:PQQ-dependent sugar dehydrogenase [Bacteroidota bacterium]
MSPMRIPRTLPRLFLLLMVSTTGLMARNATAQPQSHVAGVTVSSVAGPVDAVRVRFDPQSGRLLFSRLGGEILALDPSAPTPSFAVLYRLADHGTPAPLMGMAVAADGTIYLVGNDANTHPGYNVGVIRRGRPDGQGGHTWSTVAVTEPYPRSGTPFDHNMNAVVVSPDGMWLYVNSGSRTDHGEPQENGGQFPGAREVPLTSAILRLPADAADLVLPNNEDALTQGGYLFADGTRNSFSLAFDASGRLFGTENSGDRDDEEELNLLEEGRHYGFPWRMGLTDTPMQFAGYAPSADRLLNPASYAVSNNHFFNDPTYPALPPGIVLTDPIHNLGPHANLYRDPATGAILDADDTGRTMGTFTSHRSPLGLAFDTESALPEPFRGDALVLSWTGPESDLLGPFSGEGEDLLHLTLEEDGAHPAIRTERLASGFQNPIDAVLVGEDLYVLEFGSNASLWRVGFGQDTATEESMADGPLRTPRVDIWPNPAPAGQRARITAAAAERVRATLVGIDGREVGRLVDRFMTAGETVDLALDTSHLSRGVYFLVVEASGTRRAHGLVVR